MHGNWPMAGRYFVLCWCRKAFIITGGIAGWPTRLAICYCGYCAHRIFPAVQRSGYGLVLSVIDRCSAMPGYLEQTILAYFIQPDSVNFVCACMCAWGGDNFFGRYVKLWEHGHSHSNWYTPASIIAMCSSVDIIITHYACHVLSLTSETPVKRTNVGVILSFMLHTIANT